MTGGNVKMTARIQNMTYRKNSLNEFKNYFSFPFRFLLCLLCFQAVVLFLTNDAVASPVFKASPTEGAAPLTVQFQDLTSFVDTRFWAFGDGETAGNIINPTHTYTEPGTYTVTLSVTFDFHTETATKTITVTSLPDKPSNQSPSNGSTGQSRTPTFQTSDFSDLDTGDYHSMSEWQISTAPDFSTVILQTTSNSHLTSVTIPRLVLLENTTYYWRVRYYDANGIASEWSDAFSFTTLTTQNDQNSNGIPDSLENNTVDLDNNGQPDNVQSDIKSLNTTIGGGQMGVSIKGATTVSSIPEINAVDPESISMTSLPSSMPLGLFGMRLNVATPGDMAEVTLYFSQAADQNAVWYIYDSISGWMDYSAFSTFSADRKSVTLQLKDGSYGDADGTANGIIVDPSGFGIASWIKGLVTDATTNEVITTANINAADLDVTFHSGLDGNYFGMLLPGTYELDCIANGYETASITDLTVAEASIVTQDIGLIKKAKITGMTISGTQETFNDVTVTVDAQSTAETLYYRFSLHPDYGTTGYDGTQWTSMTSTEWVSTNSIDYEFKKNGKYIVVVWVTTDPDNANTNGIAIWGTYIEIGGSCRTEFKGFSITGDQTQGTNLSITTDAENGCTASLYYRYSVHPFYGTDGYDGRQWTSMTSSEWWTNKTINYAFTEKGKYIVVVWTVRNLNSIDTSSVPIVGWSVDIE